MLYCKPKPSLKIGTANTLCWNSLRNYGLNHIFSGTFLFCFSWEKAENFVKPDKISTQSDSRYKIWKWKLSEWAEWVEILWGFTKFFFKQKLNISVSYLVKQNSLIPKEIWPRYLVPTNGASMTQFSVTVFRWSTIKRHSFS